MSSWITITPRLEQGLEIVEKIDSGKFRIFVNKICQSFYSSTTGKIFNTEEEEKLQTSLKIDQDELNLLIDTVTLIYSQAAFNTVKPGVMESFMKSSFSISHDKITIFVNSWMTHAKNIIDNLKKKSIFPTQLEDVNWSLNVQASTSDDPNVSKPVALIQLGLRNADKKERVTVEFDKKSLTELYQGLEKIQQQLDAIK
ncbi:hypothetical protein HCN44_009018 [Aphidius gifuensis]|uniref:COMM domain-containing protein n=1 Tax=Aphidius gifuensis TaxID=684658 RepID=A0A834XN00_APHGI|nr:COMM domain-containing protein 10-like [Aphidius gifuensis]KAF7990075.1 hypothetical protein HCN44_009018 [Aphidius gifuensis]